MRYSKWALLIFGAGAVLGLAVVSAGLPRLGRVASLTMAVGIALLPVALVADWRRSNAPPKLGRGRAKPKSKRRAPAKRGRAKAKR
jgi:hypothetical protein